MLAVAPPKRNSYPDAGRGVLRKRLRNQIVIGLVNRVGNVADGNFDNKPAFAAHLPFQSKS